ncbi:MAG: hypothetical protein HPZ91_16630 [Lentisphaeria bacterium]|nr:hypothetical protein [Lentisphaeria bacterium]MBS1371570.1 hypothetical protein [Lentisphaeria bacterium]
MKKDQFYSLLEAEKSANSINQGSISFLLECKQSSRPILNRMLPWMEGIIDEICRKKRTRELCKSDDLREYDIPWQEFDECELWFLLKARPDFAWNCPRKILCELSSEIWLSLLLGCPFLAALCPYIHQFSDDDWRVIVGKHPQLSHRRPHPDRW